MQKINPDNFITIQGWMVSDLGLKGNELLIYAIIYGFSQDGSSKFTGSLQYLANWTNSTKQGVQKNLKSLVDKNLLAKENYEVSGVKLCRYYAFVDGMQQSCIPIQQSCTNNIVNNNSNTLSKDNELAQPEFNFGVIEEKPKKKTNEEEYLDCDPLIKNFTDDKELRRLLLELAGNRVHMARNERHHFYASTFKHYLDELSKVDDKIGAVNLSLQYNNTLKVMEPNKSYISVPDTNTATQIKYNSNEERVSMMARNDDGTPKVF